MFMSIPFTVCTSQYHSLRPNSSSSSSTWLILALPDSSPTRVVTTLVMVCIASGCGHDLVASWKHIYLCTHMTLQEMPFLYYIWLDRKLHVFLPVPCRVGTWVWKMCMVCFPPLCMETFGHHCGEHGRWGGKICSPYTPSCEGAYNKHV